MIWAKTDAGRTEIQSRALVKERARRNLLLLIDGTKSEETLLGSLAGVGVEDFIALRALGLIEPLAGSAASASAGARGAATTDAGALDPSFDNAGFTATLTRLISSHLGLRGFVLTLAVEKASSSEELQTLARRTIDQIRERRGDAAANEARLALFGT